MSRLTLFMLGVLMLANVPAFACGQERWAVKTLTDAQRGQIKHLAEAITIRGFDRASQSHQTAIERAREFSIPESN